MSGGLLVRQYLLSHMNVCRQIIFTYIPYTHFVTSQPHSGRNTKQDTVYIYVLYRVYFRTRLPIPKLKPSPAFVVNMLILRAIKMMATDPNLHIEFSITRVEQFKATARLKKFVIFPFVNKASTNWSLFNRAIGMLDSYSILTNRQVRFFTFALPELACKIESIWCLAHSSIWFLGTLIYGGWQDSWFFLSVPGIWLYLSWLYQFNENKKQKGPVNQFSVLVFF